jgi:hypothetical protein
MRPERLIECSGIRTDANNSNTPAGLGRCTGSGLTGRAWMRPCSRAPANRYRVYVLPVVRFARLAKDLGELESDGSTPELQRPPLRPSVFLSYARGDDEPFVHRLNRDLRARGFQVWFDRADLPSRGLTFHAEIRDAILKSTDRLIYVGGARAASSGYVRDEWQFALEIDRPVVPILRVGSWELLPEELAAYHCEDFTDDTLYDEAFEKLCANLCRPAPPLGELYAVPSIPSAFLRRRGQIERVRDTLLADLRRPVTRTRPTTSTGICGMGGAGKSVLAAALVRDPGVRRAYPDGIIWVPLNQAPDLTGRLRDLAAHLGSREQIETESDGRRVLYRLLADKAVLLVLDNVWLARDASAFDVLRSRSHTLITTRDAGVLRALGSEAFPIDLLTEGEAIELVSEILRVPEGSMPEAARKVIGACGG